MERSAVRRFCASLVLLLSPACDSSPSEPVPPVLNEAQDAQLAFSTFLGGAGMDEIRGLCTDREGNVYVTGGTKSADFPVTPKAAQRRHGGSMDAFVARLAPDGRLVWATLLGGPGHDRTYGICAGVDGTVWVAGRAGEGFPVTAGVVQPLFEGDEDLIRGYGTQDGFVAKISADGSRVLWATYFGEPGRGVVREMDVDDEGAVYVIMNEVTRRSRHVRPGAARPEPGGGSESLVAKLASDGRSVVWATYLGGAGTDIATSIRVGPGGTVTVAGSTDSADFPVTDGVFNRKREGGEDAFITRIAAEGARLEWSALLGGRANDGAAGVRGLALDRDGNVLLTGYTHSEDFPVTAGVLGPRFFGAAAGAWEEKGDIFVAKISADGTKLLHSTFLGGSACDGGEGISVDASGRVLLSGFTYSKDFPSAKGASFVEPRRGRDAMAVLLASDFSKLLFSARLGGGAEDHFRSCAIAPDGSLLLAGSTKSGDWPVKSPFQPRHRGGGDAVVTRFPPAAGR